MKYKFDKEEVRSLVEREGKPLSINTIMHRLKIPRQYRAEVKHTVKELARSGGLNKKGNKFFTGMRGPGNVIRGKVELKNNFGFLLAGKATMFSWEKTRCQTCCPATRSRLCQEKQERRTGRRPEKHNPEDPLAADVQDQAYRPPAVSLC